MGSNSDCRSENDEFLVTNLGLKYSFKQIFILFIMIIINFEKLGLVYNQRLEIPGYVFVRLYILGSVNCILVYRKWNNAVVSRLTALRNISPCFFRRMSYLLALLPITLAILAAVRTLLRLAACTL